MIDKDTIIMWKMDVKFTLQEWKRQIKRTTEGIILFFIILYSFDYFIQPILTSTKIGVKLLENNQIYTAIIISYIFICGFLYYSLKESIPSLYKGDNDKQ